MSRFFEAEFYHVGRNEWITAAFNAASIEMAQPDEKLPDDHSRIWLTSDTGGGAGILIRLPWPEMRCALGCITR